ncbi:hypothetical protein EDB85DRAFT_2144297 [Lactarius pseudohatsudake]|nr:hypothetical protein EDB85DRAFT_2144297 [Lactarius pseudohatsudake]
MTGTSGSASASSSALPPPSQPPSTVELLPANIPRLETDGSNWAVFLMRFCEVMDITNRWGFFDGSTPCPLPKDPMAPTNEEKAEKVKWEHDDKVARYLLSQQLHDTTARIAQEFTAKSVYAQNDLETAFYDMRCPRGGDVHAFLTGLRFKREELSAAGVVISYRDYQCTVLRGIPEELARFASGLLSSAVLYNHVTSIDTDDLITHICEEADRMKNYRAKSQPNKSGARSQAAGDEALVATSAVIP